MLDWVSKSSFPSVDSPQSLVWSQGLSRLNRSDLRIAVRQKSFLGTFLKDFLLRTTSRTRFIVGFGSGTRLFKIDHFPQSGPGLIVPANLRRCPQPFRSVCSAYSLKMCRPDFRKARSGRHGLTLPSHAPYTCLAVSDFEQTAHKRFDRFALVLDGNPA